MKIMTRVVALWACILQCGLSVVEMPYYLDQQYEDAVHKDDNQQALLKARKRIAKGLNATYGVVMVATMLDLDYSVHTIPIWRAYCEKHGHDFFLQEEVLASSIRDQWTKPRLLMELVAKAKWKYLWLVDPNSLPMNFEKGWQTAVKEHMRHKRFKNDDTKTRVVWCPEDCEKGHDPKMTIEEGSCYGPHVSGCIWVVKKNALPVLKTWYGFSKKYNEEERGLRLGLTKTKMEGSNYDKMYWTYTGNQMGFTDSSVLATFAFDKQSKLPPEISIRDQILKAVTGNKLLGEILNKHGQYKPGKLQEEL